MKKIAALLLALCMMIAAIPALADGEVGTWYMNLADVNMGTFELKEDGTAVFEIAGDAQEGTWKAEEGKVILTVGDESLDFAFDGASLFSEKLPIALTKEAGKLNFTQIMAMQSGDTSTLPEGMSEEDAVALMLSFLEEYTKLMGDEEAPAEEAAPAEAEAAVAP